MIAVPDAVAEAALGVDGPTYLYDLPGLDDHVRAIRTALGPHVEFFHAVKANPDLGVLRTIASHVDGLEVASAGELAHVRKLGTDLLIAFGGPGKTDAELKSTVDLFHVESRYELARLTGATALLRVNLPVPEGPAVLRMGGLPSPFGMDPEDARKAAVEAPPGVRVIGVHAHLVSGVDAEQAAAVAGEVVRWSVDAGLPREVVNVGGGMAVDYLRPDERFDWARYGRLLRGLAPPGTVLRIEPGRAVSAYHGWYATRVLDVKRSAGSWFAICAGGTHHLRTPAAKGHSQPLAVLPRGSSGPSVDDAPVTFVGQLCTPKDVLARDVVVPRVRVGDVVAFGMAGAYAYNISHTEFLMHPKPAVVHLI
ncbi:alanine racemase [Labedaea rhizosphaerae]|uniref:Diaminopimelate decarboxylase n=1 Tax=Labedaea rhizosphaerae TaxID=598644 RepID=A0A4V3CYF5_LABRH|nr:alanine racemase [Labedaea rhizosphaerae]TDP93958.1 diaminopimelate decarboxylase [Labedaea rhizosphaerae]